MNDGYQEFIKKLKEKSGIDLALYKEAQMYRRLKAFYEKKGLNNFLELYAEMSKNGALYAEFLDRMTINVSEFYRNRKRWEVLEKDILPNLLAQNRRVKVWSAACSTGEEPYTIAMILSNYIPLNTISILATDIDENVIARAKMGIYNEHSLQEMPLEMKNKYFKAENGFYKLSEDIKKTVTFKKHNLLADPYEGGFNLIICRNVLIYFTDEAKNGIYDKFSRSLLKDGILFVGSTEQIFQPDKFQLSVCETFFYRKK